MAKRLGICRECTQIEILPGWDGHHSQDTVLRTWIERHTHGKDLSLDPQHPEDSRRPDCHKGGNVVPVEQNVHKRIHGVAQLGSTISEDEYDFSVIAAEALQSQFQSERPNEMWDIRDQTKEDAHACFVSQGRPNYLEGRPCHAYREKNKRLSHKSVSKNNAIFICDACPYEETVKPAKRLAAQRRQAAAVALAARRVAPSRRTASRR